MSTERQEVLQRACNFLAKREHSRKELYYKLQHSCRDHELLHDLLDKLAEEGLQSDARFTENFVHHRCQKGHGPQKIQQELQQRGIAPELIDNFLYADKYDWYELAARARRKKFGEELPQDYQIRAKQSRFLYSRGFNMEVIHALLKT